MWNLLAKALDLLVYYRRGSQSGKPYWLDPTFVGLAVSIIATCLARWSGVDIDSDLQLKIVGVVTGIGALVSPHTGLIEKKTGGKPQVEDDPLPLDRGSN